MLLLLSFLYARYRRSLFLTGAQLIGRAGSAVARVFPLLALTLCAAMFLFLEGDYEQHYDSSWHQASVDGVLTWNDLSIDLGGNAMHNFGIQHVMKPQLSPGILIGDAFGANHRLQVEGAFLAMVMFALLVQMGRLAGARLGDACAMSLIAIFCFWIPDLSDQAITLNATLGLKWQSVAVATLLSFFLYSLIGYGDRGRNWIWPVAGLAAAILWVLLTYTETIAFFLLATSGLCLGALLGSESRREFLQKLLATIGIAVVLLALGFHNYVLNLFLYTPQMYYKALYNYDFIALFYNNTSLLMSARTVGGLKIVIFFLLAGIGIFFAWRFGNRFARRMVLGAISLEIAIHAASAINAKFELVPLTFTYVEQMGLSVIALLAGTGLWAGIRVVSRLIPKVYDRLAPRGSRTADLLSPELIGRVDRSFPYLVLLCLVAVVFHRSSTLASSQIGWPPRTDSAPAQIQARELAIKPGDKFKGKAALLLGMENPSPAMWGEHFFPIIYFKYRDELGTDLMNDAESAGIPVVNEYGHWISPPMVALLTAAFYRPGDYINRAAQAPRTYRPNLARLLGVSLVVSDQALPGEVELYSGQSGGHPLYIHRVPGANLGQYSPTRTVVARDAKQILDHLQAAGFDGRTLAIVETPLGQDLVPAERVSVSLDKGPKIHVEAYSQGTSLLVLPFDYSHCLEVQGQGIDRMIPVNLSQTGLVVRGNVTLDISYRYGPVKGTSCRKDDLERIKKLNLEDAATGRLFYGPRIVKTDPRL